MTHLTASCRPPEWYIEMHERLTSRDRRAQWNTAAWAESESLPCVNITPLPVPDVPPVKLIAATSSLVRGVTRISPRGTAPSARRSGNCPVGSGPLTRTRWTHVVSSSCRPRAANSGLTTIVCASERSTSSARRSGVSVRLSPLKIAPTFSTA